MTGPVCGAPGPSPDLLGARPGAAGISFSDGRCRSCAHVHQIIGSFLVLDPLGVAGHRRCPRTSRRAIEVVRRSWPENRGVTYT
jgi:hypothetical protein